MNAWKLRELLPSRRSLEAMRVRAGRSISLGVAGGGASSRLWLEILCAATGMNACLRRTREGASAGAALLAARTLGRSALELDSINPVQETLVPDPSWVDLYGELRIKSDQAARTVLGLS